MSADSERENTDMKVLMVEHFSPGNTYTEELTKSLSQHVQLTVLCRTNANCFTPGIDRRNVLYKGGEGKAIALISYLKALISLWVQTKSNRYDIVHVQTFKNAKAEMILYRRRNKRSRLVHTVHNLLPHEASHKDIKLYKNFYSLCDALIVHNEECKKQLVRDFNIEADKIFVIPHGCYEVIKTPVEKKDDNKIHFLMFGVIRQYKGVDILLSAISRIPLESRKRMEFVIAGKQYTEQNPTNYDAMIQDLKISDCVKLINRRIDDSELPELFAWSDACLFPYRAIYGSGALLMAYSYEKPVIASDVPVFVEETEEGKTGLLFRSEDAKDLANALCVFTNWTEAQRLECKKIINNMIQKKYNWENSAKKTYKLYNSLLMR